MLTIGGVVTYVDPNAVERPALVTAIHGAREGTPSLNLVFVSLDDDREDTYGRQIERETSIVHENDQHAHGNYWRHIN
jgi:hypothetical protein